MRHWLTVSIIAVVVIVVVSVTLSLTLPSKNKKNSNVNSNSKDTNALAPSAEVPSFSPTVIEKTYIPSTINTVIEVPSEMPSLSTMSEAVNTDTQGSEYEIIEDSALGIPYYYCSTADGSSSLPVTSKTSLVLLHGAAFTKENWKSSGILDQLCSHGRDLSVAALDLPVSARHDSLRDVLIALEEKNVVSLPVAIVTPSASGLSVVDWVQNGNVDELPIHINPWIPVACGSVHSLSETEFTSLRAIDILAVYGDQDFSGNRTSHKLGDFSNAKLVELPGGHPVYLDSPNEFVKELLNYLQISPN